MEALGELKLKWSFGYSGTPLHFIDENILVYSCGNTLTFVQSDGKHIHSCVSEGKGVGSLTVCQKARLLAYCETTLEPKIFVVGYPSCGVQIALEGGAQLEVGCLAFSGDGKKLASLSSFPDFKLVIWNCSEGNVICQANVGAGGSQLSFNPLNWKQLCLIGTNRICLYNLEQCDADLFLSPIEVEIPDRLMPVGSTVSSKLQSAGVQTDPEGAGGRQERRSTHGIALPTPPNMKQVLYKDSYDEFLQKRSPVEPVSHCWSAQQTVYIGCEHGQLLLVDFESVIVSIVANPEISMQQRACSSSKFDVINELQTGQESTAITGHALLRQGAVSILTLSKRGFFMAGKDGLVQCFSVADSLPLVDKLDVGQPIGSLAWSCSYDKLAIGTKNGAIFVVDPLKLEGNGSTLVSDHHFSDIIGIDVVGPGLQYFVSCRCDGILEVWDINEALVVSKLNLNLKAKCTTLCCPTSCSMAIIGTESGVLNVVSLTDITGPRLVQQMFLHRNPLKYTLYDHQGKFMVTMTGDGLIFLHDCRPSSQLAVLGYTDIDSAGSLLDFSIIRDSEQLRLAVLSKVQEKCLITLLTMPDHILCGDIPQEVYADATKRLSNDFVIRQVIVLNELASCFKLLPDNTATSLVGKYLSNFVLPLQDEKDMEWKLTLSGCFSVGELGNGKMISSFDQRWLGIGSIDGHIGSLILKRPEHIMFGTPHRYRSGGCNCLAFSRDGQNLITSGDSGAVTCWRIEFSELGFAEKVAAEEFAQRSVNSFKFLRSMENTALDSSMKLLSCDRTWLETAKDNALNIEDDKYATIKAELRQEISQLREKVLNMIVINEQLPDIERLDRQEFILDTEEHLRMQAEEDQLILQVTKEIELSSLACMFIRDHIKTECWDEMAVKGHTLKAFNGRLEVSNYPLKTRSEAVLNEVNRIKALRTVEATEKMIHQEVGGELKLTLQSLHTDELALDDEELGGELESHAKPQRQQEGKGDTSALLGSHAAHIGGSCERYDQFNLYSSFARKHQIVILEDCIYQIKERFNKEFDEVFRQKVMEITRIKEKSIRIVRIIQQLKLSDALVNPNLDEDETPEELLVVKDSEVLVEKYISPEEEKKLEEDKLEEERNRAQMGDNPRERALDMMMGGRLEANIEEDLFKDLPRPDFLSKDPGEMSEEEIRMAREFEKKETEFLEEREKLKKALEAELRKLQASITQGMEQFDEHILKLFQSKIKIEMTIHQQELMVLCLTRALLTEEEVTQREIQLSRVLEELKISKVHIGSIISSTKRKTEESHDQYEQMVAEDRELDKSFKRDFSDCEPFVDLLYKLFRKRPRGLRLKQGPSNEGMKHDTNSQNPFAFRPSSVTGRSQALDGNDDLMAELDDTSNMPEGLEYAIWDRFTAYRRKKIASEQKVKVMALKMAEMTAFLNKRQAEDDRVQQLIQDAFKELNKLQEDKMISDLNLEIQFLLKQGQVEIDFDMGRLVPDFSDSVLVHRSRIEELNSQIKTLGEGKLHAMAECKDFKKGIFTLEWEHQKMRMEAEDLVEKAKDIQMLRVTKELQQRLMEENVTSKDQNEIDTLEKTIEINHKMYTKSVWEQKKTLTKLQNEVNDRHVQNQHLDQQLLECQVSVAEQQQVEDLAGVPLSEANREQRMNNIVTRQKLVETIKTQDNQISILRSELERLRTRAFPALVQVD